MKAFVIICVIFAVMLGCIVFNYFYINKISNELYVLASGISGVEEDGCYAGVSQLDQYWQQHHDRVGLSVSFVELNRVSDAITSMKSYAAAGEEADFECARELLLNAIHEMRRLEAFTIGNIL